MVFKGTETNLLQYTFIVLVMLKWFYSLVSG